MVLEYRLGIRRVRECVIVLLRHLAMRRLGEARDAELVVGVVAIRIVGYDVYVLGEPLGGQHPRVVDSNRRFVLGVVGCGRAARVGVRAVAEVDLAVAVVVFAVLTLRLLRSNRFGLRLWVATTGAALNFDALDLIDPIDVGLVVARTAADYIPVAIPGPEGVIAGATQQPVRLATSPLSAMI